MKYLTRLFFFLFPKKISWDSLAGEVTAIIFMSVLCCWLNEHPNAYIYSKVGTEEAVIMMLNGFLLGQITRLLR